MAGNKNSGRGTWDREIQSKKLWDLSVPVLVHALKSKKIDTEKKIEIALSLVNKMLPREVTGPLVDNSTHLHITHLEGDELVKEARRRGIPLPEAIARRFDNSREAKPVE